MQVNDGSAGTEEESKIGKRGIDGLHDIAVAVFFGDPPDECSVLLKEGNIDLSGRTHVGKKIIVQDVLLRLPAQLKSAHIVLREMRDGERIVRCGEQGDAGFIQVSDIFVRPVVGSVGPVQDAAAVLFKKILPAGNVFGKIQIDFPAGRGVKHDVRIFFDNL